MSYEGFKSVELKRPQRSTFDLTEDRRLSLQMGNLVPIMFKEAIPSDSFSGDTEMLVRLAPLLAPIYDQVQVYVHYFFVPYRLLWDEWETFITGGQFGPNNPEGTPPPVVPQVNINDVMIFDPTYFTKSHLPDYLGVPLLADLPSAPHPVDWTDAFLDAMPFVAYQKVWYDYYRDRNFVPDNVFAASPLPLSSGNQVADDFVPTHMTLRSRAYKHDYFTSALPFPQRGAEVVIPGTAIEYLDASRFLNASTGDNTSVGGAIFTDLPGETGGALASTSDIVRVENIDNVGTLVNDWRTAYALQVWLERNAVAGSRYTESIQAHFGVRPQDSRLQRAEYCGGGLLPIKISEVVSTAWSTNEDDASIPQANMAGHGITYGSTRGFKYFCPEHGCIIGIMSIVNPPSYHQGLPRYFRRRTFLDYPFPTFAKLGEQEVYDYEIYAASFNLTPAPDGTLPVFGYQSRYADWKTGRNTNHGDFHDTLLFWSLTFDFGITPILSESFVTFNPLIEERIFAVPQGDNFWVYLHNRVRVNRPLPYFGAPNNLGFK